MNPNIDDQSPAAEALRANAGVHVRKTAKLARKIHANTVRKIVKKATRVGMGNRRGKPPRIPPSRGVPDENGIYILEEEDDERSSDDDDDEDGENIVNVHFKEDFPGDTARKAFGHHFDDAEKLPSEVLTATMETGKKRK